MKRRGWLGLCLLLAAGCGVHRDGARIAEPTPPATTAPETAAGRAPGAATPQVSLAAEEVRAEVQPYTVSAGFKEVWNYRKFTQKFPLSAAQEKLLQKNLFVCSPTTQEQLFFLYETNDYQNTPTLLTSDTVLQVYHGFYDFTLREVETGALLPALNKLTTGMLAASRSQWKEASDPKLRQAALRNVAYFGLAARLLETKPQLPPEAEALVLPELERVQGHAGYAMSAILPTQLDYSQFQPRGHYTRTPALRRFFLAMLWYGLAPLQLLPPESDPRAADASIRQALLLVQAMYSAHLEADWERIYEPTAFYVGAADDLTPGEIHSLSDAAFGAGAQPAAFTDTARIDRFVQSVRKARGARIQARLISVPNPPTTDVQLRFMGQRYVPDSEILQKLSVPVEEHHGRLFPTGLDVMSVLGSPRATAILDASPELYNPDRWLSYTSTRAKLAAQAAALPTETWNSNLYWGWLHCLRGLLAPVPEGYPSFMRSEAWADRSLHSALASWAELRHDTILYAKQSAVECGGGDDVPVVHGYVEPNVVLYTRLLALTRQSREGLTKRKLLSDHLKDVFEQFEDLLTFMKTTSEKELRNERLTDSEYDQIRYIGGQIEGLTLAVISGSPSHWFEITSATDRNMAVVADVHTVPQLGQVLEEGVGPAYELVAVVPIDGKPTLARGAAFSYYEFHHPMANRLTDEAWQALLKSGKGPKPPAWTRSFLAPGGRRREEPDGTGARSTGC